MADFPTQVLRHQTFLGSTPVIAPAAWEFGRGSTKAWAKLIELTRRGFEPFKTKRDRCVWEGQVEILSVVLANIHGMASPYWSNCALAIVIDERKR